MKNNTIIASMAIIPNILSIIFQLLFCAYDAIALVLSLNIILFKNKKVM